MEIREILPEFFKDFNLIEEKVIYATTLTIAKGKIKRFHKLVFAKSINVNGDLKLHAKSSHCSFIKFKTALTAARKWEPSFEVREPSLKNMRTIIKKYKVCTHRLRHRMYSDDGPIRRL